MFLPLVHIVTCSASNVQHSSRFHSSRYAAFSLHYLAGNRLLLMLVTCRVPTKVLK